MGRHSAPEQGPFYRSFVGWFLPWIVLAIIAGVAVWLAVDVLAGDDADGPGPRAAASETPVPTQTKDEASPTPVETVETPEPVETEPEKEEPDKPLITEGISVQVLNSTGDSSVDESVADKLSGLGFTVVAVEEASGNYETTTVFYSYPEAEKAAKRLAQRFDWDFDLKPDNLSDTVALHVVVGNDQL